MIPTQSKSKAFVKAVRSGVDYGDGTSSQNPTTQAGQLLKALIMKNAAGVRPGGGNTGEPRGGRKSVARKMMANRYRR